MDLREASISCSDVKPLTARRNADVQLFTIWSDGVAARDEMSESAEKQELKGGIDWHANCPIEGGRQTAMESCRRWSEKSGL